MNENPHSPAVRDALSADLPPGPTTTLVIHLREPLGPPVRVAIPVGDVHQSEEDGPYVDTMPHGYRIMTGIVDSIQAAGHSATWDEQTWENLFIVTVHTSTSMRRSRAYNPPGRVYLGNLPHAVRIELDSE